MNHHENHIQQINIKDFMPLIIIFLIIITGTLFRQLLFGFDLLYAMLDFMAFFFIVFASFKIINLPAFVESYQTYDIIAQKSTIYAYLYPFIELALGICYFFRFNLLIVNWITIVLMIISSIGVAIALSKKETIVCACLGAVFKIPMTYVTLAEDILMGVMALVMILKY